jgi:hypothetical protein
MSGQKKVVSGATTAQTHLVRANGQPGKKKKQAMLLYYLCNKDILFI